MSESELLESTTLETQSLGEKETHRQPKLTLHNSYRQKSIRYLDNLKTQRLNQSSCSSQQKEESIHGSPLLKAQSDVKYADQETKEQTPQDVNVEYVQQKIGNGKYDKLEVNVIEELQNSHRSSKRSSILKPKTSQRQSRVPTPRGNIEIKILESDLLQQELERFKQQEDRNIDFQSKKTQNYEQSIMGQKDEDEMDERELQLIQFQLSQCQKNFQKVLESTDNISDVTLGNPNELSPIEQSPVEQSPVEQIEQRKAVQFIGNEEKISLDLTQVNFDKERKRKRLQSDTSRRSNWSQRSLTEKAQTISLPVLGSMIVSALGFGITKLILNGKKQIVGVVPGIALGAVQLYNTIREEQMIDSDSDCD